MINVQFFVPIICFFRLHDNKKFNNFLKFDINFNFVIHLDIL